MTGDTMARDLLAGRKNQLARVAGALGDPSISGILLLGEAGIGKTTLAAAAVAGIVPGAQVLHIRGSTALRDVPYGALSSWLTGLPAEDMEEFVIVLRRVVQALDRVSRPGSSLPLLVIDDAHDLDVNSMTLIAQLLGMRRARALFLARQTPGLPQGLHELVADGIVVSVPVEPLTLVDIEELCIALLDGPVAAALVHAVKHLTLGNPLLVRLFVRDGLTREFITKDAGVWQITRHLPPLSKQLSDLVHADLQVLDDDQREAMELLAVAGPVPGDEARELIDYGVLQRLLGGSWAKAQEDGTLVPGHPMHGEALRTTIPTARRVLLQRSALHAATAPPRDVGEVLRRASLALDAGEAIDDEILLAAATSANRSGNSTLAVRALRAMRSPELDGRRLVELAWARADDGLLDEALDLVDEAFEASASPAVLQEGTLLALRVRTRRGEPAAVLHGDTDRWERLLRQAGAAPSDLLGVTVGRGLIALATDGADFDAVAVQRAADEADAPVRIAALLALAASSIETGRPVEGARLVRQAQALADTHPDALARQGQAVCLELLALVTGGEWEQARAVVAVHHRREMRRTSYLAGWLDLIDGVQALREGRFPMARSRLHAAVQILHGTEHLHLLPWIEGLAAYAALLDGDRQQAALLVEQGAAASGGSRLARRLGQVYSESVKSVLDTDRQSITGLVSLADEAESAGLLLVAATALDQALVLGDRSVLGRLADLTGSFDGREHTLLHAFARAAADADAEQLVEAGDEALTAGYRPLAAACFVHAREVYEKQRDSAAVRRAQKKLATASAGVEGPATTRAVRLPSAVQLTPREATIVTLVLQGQTNKQIAERAGTSVRTVEGHLYRIFMKFGISRREDLHLFAEGSST